MRNLDDAWDDDREQTLEIPDDYEFLGGDEKADADTGQDKGQPAEGSEPKGWQDMALDAEEKHGDPAVVKRMKKLKWEKHQENRERLKAEQERERIAQENAQLRNQMELMQRQRQDWEEKTSLESLQAQRSEKLKKMRELKDNFEDDAAYKLEEELLDINTEIALRKREQTASQQQTRRDDPPSEQQQQRQPTKADQLAQQWIADNPAFNQNPTYKAKAIEIATAMEVEEGLNPGHPAYWSALTQRLNQGRKFNSSTSAPARGHEGEGQETRGESTGFTKGDAMAMRASGKDPNDPKQRAAYIRMMKEFGGGIKTA